MIVYGTTLSPFVRKVVAFAAEKQVAIELVAAMPGGTGADFREASPFGKVPALRDRGADGGRDFTISDSTAIVAYIEARHPAPALFPADPIALARATWFEEFADTLLCRLVGAIFFQRVVAPRFMGQPGDLAAADKAEAEELPPLLDYLEGVTPADGFLLGEAVTIADVAVASPFVNYAHAGVALDAARYPKVSAYVARMHARPSFAGPIAQERAMLG